MKTVRWIYKIIRSVLFSAIIGVIAIFALLYIALSIPAVENKIRDIAQSEISAQLGGRLEMGDLEISPFNEIVISDVKLFSPDGEQVASIKKLGTGISLYSLLISQKIIFTYAEIIGLNAAINQKTENGPLNIDFIIELLKPKEKKEPPTKFNLELRSIVIRDGDIRFDRLWIAESKDDRFDPNHLHISNLNADLTCPRIKNDDFIIDLRRLSLDLDDRIDVNKLALYAHLTNKSLSVSKLNLKLPGTNISPADINLSFDGYQNLLSSFSLNNIALVLVDNKLTPSDFSFFLPQLEKFNKPLTLDIDIAGNIRHSEINRLEISTLDKSLYLNLKGEGSNLDTPAKLSLDLDAFNITAERSLISDICENIPNISPKISGMIKNIGDIALHGNGEIDMSKGNGAINIGMDIDPGYIDISGGIKKLNNRFLVDGEIDIPSLNIGKLTGENNLGKLAMNANFLVDFNKLDINDINGKLKTGIERIDINEVTLNAISLEAEKKANIITADLESADPHSTLMAYCNLSLAGENSEITGKLDIENFNPARFGLLKNYDDYKFAGEVEYSLHGNSIDNLSGNIYGRNLSFYNDTKDLHLTSVFIQNNITDGFRSLRFNSDWVDISLDGDFTPSLLPSQLMGMIVSSFPSLAQESTAYQIPDMKFNIGIKDESELFKFFNTSITPMADINISGETSRSNRTAHLMVNAPYILKGTNKLIRNTELKFNLNDATKTSDISFSSIMPAKRGSARLSLQLNAHDDQIKTALGWKGEETDLYKGKILIDTKFTSDPGFKNPAIALEVHPSTIIINGEDWNVSNAFVGYHNKILTVDNLSIRHLDQFLNIGGTASSSESDEINISLADIDLGFLFDTLAINNVTFGGNATGEVVGKGLFSGSPEAYSKKLSVKNLSYNAAVLGDGELSASWNNDLKKVSIRADVSEKGERVALIDGGLFLGKDSLSFDFDTNKVNIAFLQPFMKTFSSRVEGKATGKAKLFGTFLDVNLEGRLHADTLILKIDPTNVTYSTSGDVVIDPGIIHIPPIKIYDKFGNSGTFTGDITHKFFREANFDFKMTDARSLLCYDTNESINPVWYGTFICNGNASLHGTPGITSVDVDMSTAQGTQFTFVLNNTVTENDYSFITFSDQSLEAKKINDRDSIPPAVRMIAERIKQNVSAPSIFSINLKISTTPQALMCLIMDPVSGDKIQARGSGPININYNSFTDNLSMYGKYTLNEGTYNFTLQDIFIRDFNISEGSSVSFNGDPMNAILDISALYRVNTNLSDLDKSFSTDRELNRTNVPVDACLFVEGDLESPSISFDIQLPTLTTDMARKVKSIISTDDMMNRQILYLLALNRFYTPEYMGISSDGAGELASVASSTLSSQFSRMLGSLTDKVSVSPSFRSDRGDFSDFEMDIALSSRLLDNRLLLNGNFGYRDRKTSQTTFIGDFDIEYLLTRNGNLRLKAYNHFNDQNYYLKSALTTQGLGIVFRKDFNNPFTVRRKRKDNIFSVDTITGNDTITDKQ